MLDAILFEQKILDIHEACARAEDECEQVYVASSHAVQVVLHNKRFLPLLSQLDRRAIIRDCVREQIGLLAVGEAEHVSNAIDGALPHAGETRLRDFIDYSMH